MIPSPDLPGGQLFDGTRVPVHERAVLVDGAELLFFVLLGFLKLFFLDRDHLLYFEQLIVECVYFDFTF